MATIPGIQKNLPISFDGVGNPSLPVFSKNKWNPAKIASVALEVMGNAANMVSGFSALGLVIVVAADACWSLLPMDAKTQLLFNYPRQTLQYMMSSADVTPLFVTSLASYCAGKLCFKTADRIMEIDGHIHPKV